MTPTCNGYWINVQVYTPTAPAAYQCLTKAEYDAFNLQHQQAEQYNNHLMFIGFMWVLGIAVVAACIFLIVKKFRKEQSK